MGGLSDSVELASGASATYTLACDLELAATGSLENQVSVVPPAQAVELAPGDENAADVDTLALDYGDAPDSYGTLAASDGARHVLSGGPFLGGAPDLDLDGQPDPDAAGDGADEDGVELPEVLGPGSTSIVSVSAAAVSVLDAWIDWDRDGAFSEAERVATSQVLASGENDLLVAVPSDAEIGGTFARFRVSAAGVSSPVGPSLDGEVEDYAVRVGPIFADGFETGDTTAWSATQP